MATKSAKMGSGSVILGYVFLIVAIYSLVLGLRVQWSSVAAINGEAILAYIVAAVSMALAKHLKIVHC